jgi:aryl-alcohol dehydrogenase-like predicted oxidoreductase
MEYKAIAGMHISQLTLGTAQLGLNYGVANKNGKPDRKRSLEILNIASSHGVNCFDTAPSYGDSEKIIGSFISSYTHFSEPPIIVTKLGPINLTGKGTFDSVYHLVREHITKSVAQLQLEKIPIYLLHRASDIDIYDGLIIRSLLRLKDEGLIEILGVSVYSPEEIEHALEISAIKAIQVPINIFDHRLLRRGLLDQLNHKNFIVFARSIFLQGLFFLDPDNLPPRLELAKRPLRQLHQLSHSQGISIAEIALTFVRDLSGITSLVIGAETPNQVLEDIDLMESPPLSSKLRERIMSTFSDLSLELINPSLWNPNR